MAYDQGDPLPLQVTVRNAAGTPEDATTVVLTITAPDGTATTPELTAAGSGVYAPTTTYIAAQPGRYTARWVATGTNASTSTDIFNVLPADPRFLISLPAARAALSLPAGNTVKDEDLRGYVAAATPVVEYLTGPLIVATKVRTVDGGRTQIVLPHAARAVTSVVENGVTLSGTDYVTDLAAGIITRGTTTASTVFATGTRNVVVTYTVGDSVITDAVQKATGIIVQQMWQADQQGYRPAFGSPGNDTVTTPTGFLVPKRAVELLAPTPNMAGFA